MTEIIGQALFPHFCLGCGEEGKLLCNNCIEHEGAHLSGVFWCSVCGTPSPWGQTCLDCREQSEFEAVVSMAIYGRPIPQRLLQVWKYQSVTEAGEILSDLFQNFLHRNQAMIKLFFRGAEIVPVPLHPFRLAERGFNQAEDVAKSLSSVSGLPVRKDLLKRRWQWKKQATISDEAKRSVNAAGTVTIRSSVSVPERIVLVDDVMTTGATLNLCARELKKAGCQKVYAITVLRG